MSLTNHYLKGILELFYSTPPRTYSFRTKKFKGIAMTSDKGNAANHKLGDQFTRLVKMVML